MSPPFVVFTTRHFDRAYQKLAAKHRDLPSHFATVVAKLETDPFNLSHTHAIKKLEGVTAGLGQWRCRSGRFRFRYDIQGANVYLKACALRDESTYRR